MSTTQKSAAACLNSKLCAPLNVNEQFFAFQPGHDARQILLRLGASIACDVEWFRLPELGHTATRSSDVFIPKSNPTVSSTPLERTCLGFGPLSFFLALVAGT